MLFITQAFIIAVISGAAIAAYSGDNLQNLSPMQRLRRQAGLINRDNRNCNIQAGSACYGSIVGNRNGEFKCEDSTVEIRDNRNTDASIVSSTSNFVGNRNAKFEGTNNKVAANYNNNLSVKGDNNQLEISRTRNHAVRPAGGSRNILTVSKYDSGNTNFNFVVEYVGSAQIDGSKYRLGNYNFDVTASDDKLRVTMQNGSVKEKTSSKIVIDGQGGQTLEFNGVRVETIGSKSFDIFVV